MMRDARGRCSSVKRLGVTICLMAALMSSQSAEAASAGIVFPASGTVRAIVGDNHGSTCGHVGHFGYDIYFPAGGIIRAAADGVVNYAQDLGGITGWAIRIDHAGSYITRYFHLDPSSLLVRPNQAVVQGQQIATLNTGSGQGAAPNTHLHFEVHDIQVSPDRQPPARRRSLSWQDGQASTGDDFVMVPSNFDSSKCPNYAPLNLNDVVTRNSATTALSQIATSFPGLPGGSPPPPPFVLPVEDPVGPIDFNGDGHQDFVQIVPDDQSSVYGWFSNVAGNAFDYKGRITTGSGGDPRYIRFGDFNGDRRTDMMQITSDGRSFVWLSNGSALVQTANPARPDGAWATGNGGDPDYVRVADYGSSSAADMMQITSDGRSFVWLSNGSALVQTANPARPDGAWATGNGGNPGYVR